MVFFCIEGVGKVRGEEQGFTSFLPAPPVSSLPLRTQCTFVEQVPCVKLWVVYSGFTVVFTACCEFSVVVELF